MSYTSAIGKQRSPRATHYLSEELELDRWKCKELLREVGLPVQPVRRIVGMDSLRKYLQKNEDKAIKISRTRGDGETWVHQNYDLSETKLDSMEAKLGAKKFIQEFIVEDLVESELEVGFDGYCIDGKFPQLTMFGFEIKDRCLIDAVVEYDDLPEEVKMVNDKLSPVLKEYKYRGFFSTEIRIGKDDGLPYLIDLTCRAPIPSGEIQQEIITNWGEIMWNGAAGILTDPYCDAKFGSEVILSSEFAGQNWLPIRYPDKIDRWVKLFNHCLIEGVHYAVPQTQEFDQVGAVVGIGDTVEEANDACKSHCEDVKAYKLEAPCESLEEAVVEIEAGENNGVVFG